MRPPRFGPVPQPKQDARASDSRLYACCDNPVFSGPDAARGDHETPVGAGTQSVEMTDGTNEYADRWPGTAQHRDMVFAAAVRADAGVACSAPNVSPFSMHA